MSRSCAGDSLGGRPGRRIGALRAARRSCLARAAVRSPFEAGHEIDGVGEGLVRSAQVVGAIADLQQHAVGGQPVQDLQQFGQGSGEPAERGHCEGIAGGALPQGLVEPAVGGVEHDLAGAGVA